VSVDYNVVASFYQRDVIDAKADMLVEGERYIEKAQRDDHAIDDGR